MFLQYPVAGCRSDRSQCTKVLCRPLLPHNHFQQGDCDLIKPAFVWSPSSSPSHHLPMERFTDSSPFGHSAHVPQPSDSLMIVSYPICSVNSTTEGTTYFSQYLSFKAQYLVDVCCFKYSYLAAVWHYGSCQPFIHCHLLSSCFISRAYSFIHCHGVVFCLWLDMYPNSMPTEYQMIRTFGKENKLLSIRRSQVRLMSLLAALSIFWRNTHHIGLCLCEWHSFKSRESSDFQKRDENEFRAS